MEPERSLPCLQQPTICPYPEPDESSPHPPTLFPSAPSMLGSSEMSGPFRFSNHKLVYISHLPRACHIILHLIALIIIMKRTSYEAPHYAVFSCLLPPATSSFLRPNILLGNLFSNTLNLCASPPSFTPIQSNKVKLHFCTF